MQSTGADEASTVQKPPLRVLLQTPGLECKKVRLTGSQIAQHRIAVVRWCRLKIAAISDARLGIRFWDEEVL